MVIESGDHAELRCLPPGPAAISRILPVPPGRAPGRIRQRTCRLASPATRLALTTHPMITA
jgi:hypothetical protein